MPPTKSKKKDIPSQQHKQTQLTNRSPNWPALRPLVPASDLYIEPILDDQIYIIRNFFTANLCKSFVSFLSSSISLTTTPLKPKSKDEAVRVNDRYQVDDAGFAELLWSGTALKEVVNELRGINEEEDLNEEEIQDRHARTWGGTPLGLNSNIRIYRYTPGQFFAQHYDESNAVQFYNTATSKSLAAHTTWTLLIYLTTTDGGETVFYPEDGSAPIPVDPEVGMALLHRHGEHCLLHEGREVRSGEKWVLRSDLVVR
ncbi:hypothetical protein BGW36DRAFT_377908 [Talaromyces proteolyticus]|uniref:Fe2OG dioxygenase domain-containing protein n=1 Tax=Talaromyces proteolyticus TaxID=1131652 RepID=A0AAD4KQ84_9EURO|nr:uncharacterized protein BGW36DRAFT_377908 [Talaromyces proteolyticus]KAH8697084.1 hypothetical protein BGW36DRAFT_377908 [Talaromyces proteolyticus]